MVKTKKENPRKAGQKKTECTPEVIQRALELSSCLMLDCQILESLDVSTDTFYKWKRENSQFADALKRGRSKTIEKITNNAIKKSENDPLMMMFFLKNKAKYMEYFQQETIDIKKKEIIIKRKELILKTDKFAAELSEKFNLNKEEVLQVLNKYTETVDDNTTKSK